MRHRTRLFVTVASATLVIGVATAGVASYVGLERIGLTGTTGNNDLTFIPGSAQMVGFADVRHLMDSNLRHVLQPAVPDPSATGAIAKNPLEEIGLNPETDIDSVVMAALPGASPTENMPLLVARGRFDSSRIEAAVSKTGGVASDYRGTRIVSNEKIAVAFVETGLVLVGQPTSVRLALDTKANGVGSVTTDEAVMRLVRRVNSSDTWVVANFEALQALKQLPVAPQLPAITWLAAGGDVGDGVAAHIFAEGRDDRAAQDLREVVKGFVALARMQTGQQAAVNEFLNSIELTGEGNTVTLSFALPAQFFEQLKSSGALRNPNPTPRPAANSRRPAVRPAA